MSDPILSIASESVEPSSETRRFSDAYLKLRKKFMVQRTDSSELSKKTGESEIHEKRSEYNEDPASSPSITEKHLRAIWYDSRFERRGLRVTDGRKISVISPGNWNAGVGPDFKNARLRIGDRILEGDVELHLRSADWVHHRHHEDPQYNRVVLHVVLFHNSDAETVPIHSGKRVPQLELKNSLTESADTLATTFEVDGYPYKSNALLGECGKVIGLPAQIKPEKYDFIQMLLNLAGDGRILLKSEGMSLAEDQVDVLVYSRILEGLGYSQNKSAMKELSQRVSYELIGQAIEGTSGELRVLRLQALLLGAAGLIPEPASSSDDETKKFVLSLKTEWENCRGSVEPMDKSRWVFKGIRPQNYPTRRLAGFSYFLAQNSEKGLFSMALEIVQKWKKEKGKISDDKRFARRYSEIEDIIFQTGWGYFGHRTNFGPIKFQKKVALIGEDRAITIWVNAYLPLLVLWCRKNQDEKLEEELHRFWSHIPLLVENQVSKMMKHRFLGSKAESFILEREQSQQGFIQIFQDFCDMKPTACIGCPFPRLVSLSTSQLFQH